MRPPAAKSVTLMASGYALGLLLGGGHRGPVVDTLCVVVAALLFAVAVWVAWCEWRASPARQPGSPFAPWPEENTVCSGPCTVATIGTDGDPRLVCKRQCGEAMCVACPERGQQP